MYTDKGQIVRSSEGVMLPCDAARAAVGKMQLAGFACVSVHPPQLVADMW